MKVSFSDWIRKNAEVKHRNLIEKIDRLKEKIEEVKKEVSVRTKNRAEGGRSENGIEQVGLNNFIARSEEGTRKQGKGRRK